MLISGLVEFTYYQVYTDRFVKSDEKIQEFYQPQKDQSGNGMS